MKISPISIVHYPYFDHLRKAIFTKNEENGNVRVEEVSYPLYNKKGQLVNPIKGTSIDLEA